MNRMEGCSKRTVSCLSGENNSLWPESHEGSQGNRNRMFVNSIGNSRQTTSPCWRKIIPYFLSEECLLVNFFDECVILSRRKRSVVQHGHFEFDSCPSQIYAMDKWLPNWPRQVKTSQSTSNPSEHHLTLNIYICRERIVLYVSTIRAFKKESAVAKPRYLSLSDGYQS